MAVQRILNFAPGDRYLYDFNLCSSDAFFAQLDTKQDASYFGTWANPRERTIFTYCEGDTTLLRCDTNEEFVAEIRRIEAWNIENGYRLSPERIIGIDPGFNEELKEAFVAIGLSDLLH